MRARCKRCLWLVGKDGQDDRELHDETTCLDRAIEMRRVMKHRYENGSGISYVALFLDVHVNWFLI